VGWGRFVKTKNVLDFLKNKIGQSRSINKSAVIFFTADFLF